MRMTGRDTLAMPLEGLPGQEYETLVEIGKALTTCLDLDGIYAVVMDKVSQLLRPDSWSLLIADEGTGELYFAIAVSPCAEKLKGIRLCPGEGIAGWVAEQGLPLLVSDVRQDPRFSDQVDKTIGFETHSIVCVPLRYRSQTLGVIQLINSLEQHSFCEKDLQILSTIADFTAIAIENARLLAQVNRLIITDALTGLHNDRHFHELLGYEFERARRYQTELSMVFIDLDHFKQVNDTFGHLTGSQLLREVGQVIRENSRQVDHAARYGGDEFVILLPATGKAGAFAMASNLRDKLREHNFRSDDGHPIKVTASFGIATYPQDASTKEELVHQADLAMYTVKNSSRDGVRSTSEASNG